MMTSFFPILLLLSGSLIHSNIATINGEKGRIETPKANVYPYKSPTQNDANGSKVTVSIAKKPTGQDMNKYKVIPDKKQTTRRLVTNVRSLNSIFRQTKGPYAEAGTDTYISEKHMKAGLLRKYLPMDKLQQKTAPARPSEDETSANQHININESIELTGGTKVRRQPAYNQYVLKTLTRKFMDATQTLPATVLPVPTCNLTVTQTSAEQFKQFLVNHNEDAVKVIFEFNDKLGRNVTVKRTPYVVQPEIWIWIGQSSRTVNFLMWPYDLHVESLTLLPLQSFTPVSLVFDTYPDNCIVYFGERTTTEHFSKALRNFTEKYLTDGNYSNAKWCFREEDRNFNKTALYMAAVNIGWPVSSQYIRHRCCETRFDWEKNRVHVNCPEGFVPAKSLTWPLLTIICIPCFCLCPLLLIYAYPNPIKRRNTKSSPLFHDPRGLEDSFGINVGTRNDELVFVDRKDGWVYLDGEAPIKLFRKVFSFGGLMKRYPKALSRCRRFLWLIISPAIIYINIFLHHLLIPELYETYLRHKAPLAFLTVSNSDNGRTLFVPYFGGPIGFILLYYILGTIFLVVPGDLETFLSSRVKASTMRIKSPLFMDVNLIEKLSSVKLINRDGLACVSQKLKAHLLMVWRPLFWMKVASIQYSRFSDHMCSRSARLGFFSILICLLFVPAYVVLCILESLLCAFFYGVPLFGLTVMGSVCAHRYLCETLKLRLVLFDICFSSVIVVTAGIYVFLCSIIFVHSLAFLCQILLYTYIAAIIHPSSCFGYLFFGITILSYMYKRLSRVSEEYNELLVDIVKICCRLEFHPTVPETRGTNLHVQAIFDTNIQRICINGRQLHLKPEETCELKQRAVTPRLIHDVGLYCGVPYRLFRLVVQKHKPLYIQVFRAFLQISLIISFLTLTVQITNSTGASKGISDFMHVFFIVIMGALPHVLDMSLAQSTMMVKKDVWLKEVEQTIRSYK